MMPLTDFFQPGAPPPSKIKVPVVLGTSSVDSIARKMKVNAHVSSLVYDHSWEYHLHMGWACMLGISYPPRPFSSATAAMRRQGALRQTHGAVRPRQEGRQDRIGRSSRGHPGAFGPRHSRAVGAERVAEPGCGRVAVDHAVAHPRPPRHGQDLNGCAPHQCLVCLVSLNS